MHKNQLQELAQRSNFNLPAYSCIREGPDHAPRFKATVNFDGELFESPGFFSTLRQAEHAAAEVALNVLSKRGPSQSLAAKVLDETGICKNLLQETAQRAGVSLPMYTTTKGAVGHVPAFNCTVEVGGRVFAGEPAKSKKQAEKNAAMVAWSSLKQWSQPPWSTDFKGTSTSEKFDSGSSAANALPLHNTGDGRAQVLSRFHGGRSRVRMVNVRGRNHFHRELSPVEPFLQRRGSSPAREVTYESRRFLFNQQPSSTSRDLSWSGSSHQTNHLEGSLALPPSPERSYESQRFLFNQQSYVTGSDAARSGGSTHQRRHSLTGFAFDPSTFLPQSSEGSSSGGGHPGKTPFSWQQQPRASRLFLQSSSDRIELRRPLVEELQLHERDGKPDWFGALGGTTSAHVSSETRNQQQQPTDMLLQSRRAQSERFELKPSLFDELYQRDEEEWWSRGETMHLERQRVVSYEGCGNTGKYISDYSNEPSSIHSPYDSQYNNAASSYAGFGSNASQRSSLPHYTEHSNSPTSSYAAFNRNAQGAEWRRPSGRFNIDTTGTFLFSNEGRSGSTRNVHDVEGTPSSSRWPQSVQWSNSLPWSPSSRVSNSSGFRTSSLPPPVRVRQMVAVCSASSPQVMTVENTAATNTGTITNIGNLSYGHAPSIDHNTEDSQSVVSTNDSLKQLRLK